MKTYYEERFTIKDFRRLQRVFKALDMNLAQFQTLIYLADHPQQKMTELSEVLNKSRTAAAHHLYNLELRTEARPKFVKGTTMRNPNYGEKGIQKHVTLWEVTKDGIEFIEELIKQLNKC